MSMERYNSGRLSEAVLALVMPVMSAESQANAVYRCASDAPANAINATAILAEVERLERAAATLREAAAMVKPMPYLVAAE